MKQKYKDLLLGLLFDGIGMQGNGITTNAVEFSFTEYLLGKVDGRRKDALLMGILLGLFLLYGCRLVVVGRSGIVGFRGNR